jgi:hypothetical protein
MKAICKHNTGDFFKENELPTGVFSSSIFNLEIEKEYLVMGIILSGKFIFYLSDENGKPFWYPCELFQVSDNKISPNWYFKSFPKDDSIDIDAIWGYSELCNQENYFDQLMDRDDSAMRIYFKRRMETGRE